MYNVDQIIVCGIEMIQMMQYDTVVYLLMCDQV